MGVQRQGRAVSFLLGIYIVSLAFTDLWVLPGLSRKFQLPEAVFLVAFFLVTWAWREILRPLFRSRALDLGLLLFLPVSGLAAFIAPGKSAYLEVLGLGYLWLVYWLFSRHISQEEGSRNFFLNAIWWLGGVIGVISICSILLTWQGLVPAGYLAEWKLVPYLGPVIRVSGLAVSPNLWATTIEFSLLMLLGALLHSDKKRSFFFMFLLLLVALLLTFSKSIVAFIAALGLMLPSAIQAKRLWKMASVGIGLGALLFYIFTSHVLILSETDTNYPALKEQPYLARQSILHCCGFELVKTTQMELKKQAVRAFRSSSGLGVGGGQFFNFIKAQKEKGAYPGYLPAYEPHSTYFGLLAEVGILGLLALAWAVIAVLKTVRQVSKLSLSGIDRALFWGARAYLLLMIIEAVAVDVLNFRTLWVALGIIGAIRMSAKKIFKAGWELKSA